MWWCGEGGVQGRCGVTMQRALEVTPPLQRCPGGQLHPLLSYPPNTTTTTTPRPLLPPRLISFRLGRPEFDQRGVRRRKQPESQTKQTTRVL